MPVPVPCTHATGAVFRVDRVREDTSSCTRCLAFLVPAIRKQCRVLEGAERFGGLLCRLHVEVAVPGWVRGVTCVCIGAYGSLLKRARRSMRTKLDVQTTDEASALGCARHASLSWAVVAATRGRPVCLV